MSNPIKKDTDNGGLDDYKPGVCTPRAYLTKCEDITPKKYHVSDFIGSLMSDFSYVNMESLLIGNKKPFMEELKSGSVVSMLNR